MQLSTKIEFHVCNSLRENISYIKTALGMRNDFDIEFQNVEMHLLLEIDWKAKRQNTLFKSFKQIWAVGVCKIQFTLKTQNWIQIDLQKCLDVAWKMNMPKEKTHLLRVCSLCCTNY